MWMLILALAFRADRQPRTGASAVHLGRSIHYDVSRPLRELPAIQLRGLEKDEEPDRTARIAPLRAGLRDPVAQLAHPLNSLALASRGFEGLGDGIGTEIGTPPDANGDVGLHHYLQASNGHFAVFSKPGAIVYGPADDQTLWSGFAGVCGDEDADAGDPVALYDALADRWILSHMAWSGQGGRECVAISQNGDPLGKWYRYEFTYPTSTDYTKLAVWPSAYVVTTGLDTSLGVPASFVCALDRQQMLIGAAATQQCFTTNGLQPMPADLDGAQPPPSGSPALLVDLDVFDGSLGIYRLSIDWQVPGNSRLSSRIAVPTAPWSAACGGCIPQPGTSRQLATTTGTIMHRVTYRNFGDHETLLLNHSVDVAGVTGIRWYEIRLDGNDKAAIYQQGTFAPDSSHRWMASLAMDRQGNIAMGYSVSSSALYPSIRYTGRLASDALGSMTVAEASLYEGAFSQTSSVRWGDYAAMQVDPIDDCTFWFTTEYAGQRRPGTRINSFRFPACGSEAFSVSLEPQEVTVERGKSVTVRIVSALKAGAPQPMNLRIDGLPVGITASLSQPEIAAGDSTNVTLTAESNAATGERVFSVEGTSRTFQSGALGRVRVGSSGSGCASAQQPDSPSLLILLCGALLVRATSRRRPATRRLHRTLS